ncbi:AcvB/VirJ family lysyl-phosphatidylglycerol hydrolase [Telmatospirillum sp.]|uniref:AcvB/VirJ family lysyl-phosphatidylglycerol hydrolase n=1 Tax=Telmatospirillum sp. TaxID=2079197 RepID=UPI002846B2F9|nr:AcvB/VirJ family lysyl-phosphatidylglycerol hydrolase [Telmatospirillum sp.]MDR3437252.1 AcvB/VirJ family lysyl-phosphatidylglycerol hydrolase [Telmatospirillum sp.]
MRISAALAGLALLAGLASAQAAEVAGLPTGTLVEYRSGDAGNRDLAVILSGDGGWADLDRQLGTILVGRGMSVVGFDCMKYFWDTRSPEDTARDVDAALAAYLKAWDKDRVVLIGFSFGAAVLPFVLSRMPESLKSKLALTVLLSGNTYANWEIHWGDWLHDQPHKSARPVVPELAKVQGAKLLCVFGTEEAKTSLCPALPSGTAEILELPGDHHFDKNYSALADQILRRVPR